IAATWLGHACFLLQLGGLNVLADPCCSERCSPSQWAGPKRIRPLPCGLEELANVDAVVISHSHYDHLDVGTIEKIGKGATYFVPLGIGAWFASNFPGYPVREMDWWDSSSLAHPSDPKRGVEFTCTPCQHFSGRTLWDRDTTLWSSWSLKALDSGRKVFFAGDTGYRSVPKGFTGDVGSLPHCPAFKEIGDRLGPFDLAAIPIGAYSPRWFMSPVHLDPRDAVDVHRDVRSKKSVGMHWGTFILTDEPVMEPPIRLAEEAAKGGLGKDEFVVVDIGATLVV
ncbi:beta-lactamase superfamily domain-containing protein, partial [Hyaloraphidium curvatum]